jgi:hypothetical protein
MAHAIYPNDRHHRLYMCCAVRDVHRKAASVEAPWQAADLVATLQVTGVGRDGLIVVLLADGAVETEFGDALLGVTSVTHLQHAPRLACVLLA